MRISSATTAAFITMVGIASAALAMMMPSGTGSARTAGTPRGATTASSTSPTGRSASTPPCGPSRSRGAASVTTLTYQAGDRGRTVSLAVGARFVVALEENPTTGYEWSAPAFEGTSLALEADDYTLAKGAAIGGGGIRK